MSRILLRHYPRIELDTEAVWGNDGKILQSDKAFDHQVLEPGH
jgi:hypothetical protein